ncbi:short-chain dehydrogenase [Photobacterium rosenbergii]|uniref:Short-chain dehydrogenase n=1 Tax=Photobacterium rosenbergii TaxID=294936 RepID=A0A2T3N9W8_9GAMM|nr:oxidoreductase [Photobacterium rosenbergii]PSW10313.1 short-chain dehydrogenase [Photobacterium rosenbergii]
MTTKRCWSLKDIPDLTGKTAIVTGGNTGLGFKTTLELARNAAKVVLACRNEEKGKAAINRLRQTLPEAELDVISLDLTCRQSIENFVHQVTSRYSQLDILVNNAGVVNLAQRQTTPEGFEMHMATNHLGHFALTGRLLPALLSADHARVVTVSSGGYKYGTINFDDFNWQQRPYHRVKAYGDSKLANLLFSYQLQRYFDSIGANAMSVAAHPGLTGTERQQTIGVGGVFSRSLASSVDNGCRSQLLAATAPNIKPQGLYGPRYGIWGSPALHKASPKYVNAALAQQLWDFSEDITGVRFPTDGLA